MPFAGFDDWDSCIRTMTEEEGHDQSAAERICGALQDEAKSEHGNVEELKDALARGRGLIADVGVDLNSAVDQPAINSKWTMFKSTESEGHDTKIDAPLVLKQDGNDAEKRIAYAPAMIPREVDKEGDVVPTPTVEKAAHDYLKQGGGVDSDHDLIDGKGEPVESWIEPTERKWDLPDGDTETYPAGTWMVGIEWDAKTWDRIQSGELEGLSIYGKADHVPLAKSEGEGATPKNDAGESSEQDSIMSDSDTDVGSRLTEVEASVSDVQETVESIKEAVASEDTDKQPDSPGGDAGSVIRDAAQALANHEDVSGNTDEIASDLKSMFLSSKEDDMDGDGEMGDEEDDEEERESESDSEKSEETEKSTDSDPNFSKTEDGGESASVAKDAQGTAGSGGVPSYRAAAENEGDL